MPKKIRLGSSNQSIQLEATPFAAGGEGELYRIVMPLSYRKFVAKLYFKDKRTEKQAAKIQYLINNPPELVQQEGHQSIIWMEDSLTEDGEFAGFIMPFAKGKKLEILCTQKLPRKLEYDWKRFDLTHPDARELRQKICFNIAAAVFQIHKTHKYVLVDLKPDNVMIQSNGLISIVDIDSVQVIEDGQMMYPARVATPEFSPPEYFNNEAKPGKTAIFETWDRFSMAVIFYKLLFGIHPYAGTAKPPYDSYVSLQDKIQHGLFVHSPTKKSAFTVTPPPHRAFYRLPVHLQNLFVRCFEYGHTNVYDRPSANEWCWGTTPRPPLINLRQLPSTALPMKAIQYTPAISLSPVNANIKLPDLQHRPPSKVRFKLLDTNFRLIRATAIGAVGLGLFWMFGRNMPFTFITFFQMLSIGVTTLLIALVDYYSLEAVKEKHQILLGKEKLAKKKREKRKTVNHLIRAAHDMPQTEQELQNKFYVRQNEILQEERFKIDKVVSEYRRLIAVKDQKVLNLNQEELNEVQNLEKKLLDKIDLEPISETHFLPIPDKLEWVNQRIEQPSVTDEVDFLAHLKELKIQLMDINEEFLAKKEIISKAFDDEHDDIKIKCEKEFESLMEKVEGITSTTDEQKKKLFDEMLSNHSERIKKSNENLEEVKKQLLELEDAYKNFNTVSDKLLEYRDVTFLKYLRKGILFRK